MNNENTEQYFKDDLIISYNKEEERLSIYNSESDKLLILDGALGLYFSVHDKNEPFTFYSVLTDLVELCPHIAVDDIKEQIDTLEDELVHNEFLR
ncbi:hypothetical protein [Bacteriovorax sp. Seq25_V]|uniref:hypothetical protein n=1 Tax=Bacteriovorax sp. Seq25_V TaxID=1201288 RepID=UPI00054E8F66|nr:hypothetical protein [Bacteriovorax sp. Seq25_V]